jgi:hypothetical protein
MSVLVAVGLAVLTLVTNVVVGIKIKFAPDAATAAQDLKAIGLRVGFWLLGIISLLGIAWTVFNLNRAVTSTQPITRQTIFYIAFSVAAVFYSLSTWLLLFTNLVMYSNAMVMGKIATTMREYAQSTDSFSLRVIDVIEKHFEITKDLASHQLAGKPKDSRADPPNKGGG